MSKAKNTKVLFIEARKKFPSNLFRRIFENDAAENALKILPQKFLIAYSIQYKELAYKLKDFLEKKGRKIAGIIQVLGCSVLKTRKHEEKNILLVGSGKFHAVQLALQGKNIYIYENGKIFQLAEEEIKKIFAERKVAISKFYSADAVGIIVSCKYGQENLNLALNLKKKIDKMGKSSFIFLADTIDLNELDNFPVQSWVNTACPGIALSSLSGKNVVNYTDIKI